MFVIFSLLSVSLISTIAAMTKLEHTHSIVVVVLDGSVRVQKRATEREKDRNIRGERKRERESDCVA